MKQLALDADVIDTLMADLVGHDKKPAAFIVYLCLWRKTWGARVRSAQVSLQGLANDTGLSKSAVQTSVRWLRRRHLVRSERDSPTATPRYTVLRPWR